THRVTAQLVVHRLLVTVARPHAARKHLPAVAVQPGRPGRVRLAGLPAPRSVFADLQIERRRALDQPRAGLPEGPLPMAGQRRGRATDGRRGRVLFTSNRGATADSKRERGGTDHDCVSRHGTLPLAPLCSGPAALVAGAVTAR